MRTAANPTAIGTKTQAILKRGDMLLLNGGSAMSWRVRKDTMSWRGGQTRSAPYCGVARTPISDQYRKSLVQFGDNLRKERQRLGYTQEKLAELVDLHPRVLQKIEAGQTNIVITTALRIQVVLDCPWTDLLPKVSGAARKAH